MDDSMAMNDSNQRIAERADQLEAMNRFAMSRRVDHLFAFLLPLQWVVAWMVASALSPLAWEGLSSKVHPHLHIAVVFGGVLISLPTYLGIFRSGEPLTRHLIAVAQMLMGSILIHLSGGRIETHFHIFGSLAFLAIYRDTSVLVTATVVVLLDHYIRGAYWPVSIFGTDLPSSWRWLEHAGWILFEDFVLYLGGTEVDAKAREVALRQAELESTRDRIEQEVATRTSELSFAYRDLENQVIERERAEAARQGAEQRAGSILEAVVDGIVTCDVKGVIDSHNPAASKLFGDSETTLIGRTLGEFILSETFDAGFDGGEPAPFDLDRAARSKSGLLTYELLARRDDGAVFPVELSLCQFTEGDHQIFIGTIRDITERKLAEQALRQAHTNLEERVFERTAELEWTNESLTNEVAERSRIEAELRAGEERLRFQADAMPQIVWTADPDGVHDSFNKRWQEYTGLAPADSTSRFDWRTVIHPGDVDETVDAWNASVSSGHPFECEYRLLSRETGNYRWHLGRAIALHDENGSVVQWVGTCTDIDDQKRNEEALRRAHDDLDRRVRDRTAELQLANETMQTEVIERRRAEAEALRAREIAVAATRAKSDFLANMSHEIRTPMNGVIGMTELALDTELDSRQREYLEMVRSSADALLTVINDILDFSKIEADKLDLDSVPFEVHSCLEETLHTLALRAHAKGLELACRIGTEVPGVLVGDPNRLRQIVVNLVGNAIKFTSHGEVFVAVGAENFDENHVRLTIAVTDTGIGIPESKRQRIFEPFEQADGSTTRTYGGTGLGLAIASKLIDLMGGRIGIESEVGKGSTFSFTAVLGKTATPISIRGDFDPSKLANLPVLIVDDNATNRRILEEILSNWGAVPTSAATGTEALKHLRRAAIEGNPFPIALIDVMMPEMDGFSLAEAIRRDPLLGKIVLMVLTSAGRTDDMARSKALGIASFLTKPVRQAELLASLIASLPDSQAGTKVADSLSTTIAGPLQIKPKSVRPLRVLLADDHPVNQKMAVRMLEAMGHSTVVAADGREAVDRFLTEAFDVILMDVQMPVMDGFEAVAEIRRSRSTGREQIPIIAVTAHAMKGDRERCIDRGFDGYLAKPIRFAELFRTLEEIAAKCPAADESPKVADSSSSRQSEADDLAAYFESVISPLRDRCGGDPEFAKEILDSFVETAPQSLWEIEAAKLARNPAALAIAAHGLKGAALTVCADDIADACKTLEEFARKGNLDEAVPAADRVAAFWERFKSAVTSFDGVHV